MVRVDPGHIRRVGRNVDRQAGEWAKHVGKIKTIDTGAFGDDVVGQRITSFHARAHGATITYLTEVGECCSDMGIALIRTANLYAETERDNATKSILVRAEMKNLGDT